MEVQKFKKNPKKCDFYGIFYHLNKDIFSYKGLPIDKKLLEVVRIFEVLQTTLGRPLIFNPKNQFLQNMFGRSDPKFVKF